MTLRNKQAGTKYYQTKIASKHSMKTIECHVKCLQCGTFIQAQDKTYFTNKHTIKFNYAYEIIVNVMLISTLYLKMNINYMLTATENSVFIRQCN